MKYDVTLHYQVEADSEEHAIIQVTSKLDQDDVIMEIVQITDVEEIDEFAYADTDAYIERNN